MDTKKIAILGAGNLGFSIAQGLLNAGIVENENLVLTENLPSRAEFVKSQNFNVVSDNKLAIIQSGLIIIAVKPKHLETLLAETKDTIDPSKHVLASCVTGASSQLIYKSLSKKPPLFLVMPNTGISIQQSMTCIATSNTTPELDKEIEFVFSKLGEVIFIQEEEMPAATVMAGCGIAFALRFIRAAMQGGVEIGFKHLDAQKMAAQIAKGAAGLVLATDNNPEAEIDKVTTPGGITISGLNEMEHQGITPAIIKGIQKAYNKVKGL